ncbi:MAG: DUF814 domain-containing protein [Ignavibacteriae bacterium]|nr:DUF814 domain-containing protein [Ignavibacteriota bacterium]
MLDNFYLLKEVSSLLQKEINGYLIKDIFTQEKDKLVFHLSNNFSDKFLEFSCSDKLPFLIFKEDYKKAKRNVLSLMPGLYELKITGIYIFNNDRIVQFSLTGGIDLYFVFFRLKNNLLVVTDGKIIDTFRNKKELIGRTLNEFVARKEEHIRKKYGNIKEYFRSECRTFGDLPMKEFLFLKNLKGTEECSSEIKISLDKYINEYEKKLLKPDYILYSDGKNLYTALARFEHLSDCEAKVYNNINDMIQAYLKMFYSIHSGEDLRKSVINSKENQLKAAEKKYNSLVKQLETAGNADLLKTYGDLILSNLHIAKKGDDKITIDGDAENEIAIILKRELSPAGNAASYYEKYKRLKNSIELLKEKIEVQKNIIVLLKKEIEELKSNQDLKVYKMKEKELTKEDETSRFRKFRLNDKFEVWVGKDSASNDMLTVRYSAQNDLWFHIRGASGSHTVLKISDKKNPPEKKIIETAASIAAYYSKARNASSVPVAYCERKYVKKKKGFKEGSVIMEREKVLFVKPGLPENII